MNPRQTIAIWSAARLCQSIRGVPPANERAMKSRPAAPHPPQLMPQSLPAQTVGILKEKILSGDWGQTLPSERELSDWLVVSRGTLRAALARLQREGIVKSRQGRPWEIVVRKKNVRRRTV